MRTNPLPMLSKSRCAAGLQCLKRLYLECYEPGLAPPPSAATQVLFDTGAEVGIVARRLHPGGVLVEEDYLHHRDAAARTSALLADASAPAIFEAAFTADGIRVRADLLVRLGGGGWELVEVKSSTSVKPQYVDDVAIQLWALDRAGIDVRRASIAYINNQYVYPGGEYDPHGLFTVEDVTSDARARLVGVPGDLLRMRAMLAEDAAPAIATGPQCKSPYDCEFIAYCHRDEPEWPVSELPRLGATRVEALHAAGVRSILDLPDAAQLNETQRRVRDAVWSATPYVSPGLSGAVETLRAPAHFIDFETIAPALPRYAGTRPFEQLPFQWSDHVLDEHGQLSHFEFLADGPDDPRTAFTESLLAQLRGAASVTVYSSYEASQLRRLAEARPALRSGIESLLALPWLDLLAVVRAHYYDRDFHGSYSLKSVLPVLVPQLGYGDLTVRDGNAAQDTFIQTLRHDVDPADRERFRADLLAYCGRDTLAMVEIVRALRRVAAG